MGRCFPIAAPARLVMIQPSRHENTRGIRICVEQIKSRTAYLMGHRTAPDLGSDSLTIERSWCLPVSFTSTFP